MPPLAASLPPLLSLDSSSQTPMYRQLYDWFRQSIADGQLHPGQRVPSTRSLAAELKISRIPVFNAYEQLCAEGYLETFVGAGTCVAKSIPEESLRPALKKRSTGSGEIHCEGKASPNFRSWNSAEQGASTMLVE